MQTCDVVVVGAGPSGIFSGVSLSESNLDVVILERGKSVEGRKCTWNCKNHRQKEFCNVQNGVGGCGLFSDSCLHYSTKVGGGVVKESLFEHYRGIIDGIYERSGLSTYRGYPKRNFLHKLEGLGLKYANIMQRDFGEDRCVALVEYLMGLWGDNIHLKTDTEVLSVSKRNSGFIVETANETFLSKYVIFGTGQASHDLLFKSCKELGITVNTIPTTFGFRIETLYENLREVTEQYYNWKVYGKRFRTFCVNNGGRIVMHLGEMDRISTNGTHSHSETTLNTNLAIVGYMHPDKLFPMVAKYPKFAPPTLQRWGDLLENRTTTREQIERNSIKPTLKKYSLGNARDFYGNKIVDDFVLDMKEFAKFSPNMISPDLIVTIPEIKYFYTTYPLSDRYESLEMPGAFFVGDCNSVSYAIVLSSMSGFISGSCIVERERKA